MTMHLGNLWPVRVLVDLACSAGLRLGPWVDWVARRLSHRR